MGTRPSRKYCDPAGKIPTELKSVVVSDITIGKVNPTLYSLLEIANALDGSLATLMDKILSLVD
jgi:hypothetical protein